MNEDGTPGKKPSAPSESTRRMTLLLRTTRSQARIEGLNPDIWDEDDYAVNDPEIDESVGRICVETFLGELRWMVPANRARAAAEQWQGRYPVSRACLASLSCVAFSVAEQKLQRRWRQRSGPMGNSGLGPVRLGRIAPVVPGPSSHDGLSQNANTAQINVFE